MSELITVAQLAKFLKISPKTIYNLVSLKKIPYVKAGGALRFKYCEIDDWLNPLNNSKDPTAKKAHFQNGGQ